MIFVFSVIDLIVNFYNLIFNNDYVSQSAHKIPENLTIDSHELA